MAATLRQPRERLSLGQNGQESVVDLIDASRLRCRPTLAGLEMTREEKLKKIEKLKKSKAIDDKITRDMNLLVNKTVLDRNGVNFDSLKQRYRLIANAAIARRLVD